MTWPQVLRVLQNDETRSYAIKRFKDMGFSAATWSRPAAKAAMAEALTRTEDWHELTYPRRTDERRAIRDVRRRLENQYVV